MIASRQASVLIVTKNRKEELCVALRSVLEQTVQSEVVVMDDGSTDGTSERVRAEFPNVTLHSFVESKGCIVRRNEGARLVRGEILISIDDDAAFSTPRTVEQTLAEFDCESIAAVAIPFIDVHKSPRLMQKAPDTRLLYITDTFIGTAHAFRRDVFLSLGGYREDLFHQGEESDFCIRLLQMGRVVRLGNADPIHHFESPKRDFQRMDFYGPRNSVLFAWQNVPFSWLFVHMLATTLRCLFYTLKPDRFKVRLSGIIDGFRGCFRMPREPVSLNTYRLNRQLRKNGPLRFDSVQSRISSIKR